MTHPLEADRKLDMLISIGERARKRREAIQQCPQCDSDLEARSCKMRCPKCGFFSDCGDVV